MMADLDRELYDESFLVRMTVTQKQELVRAAAAVGEPLAVYIRRAVGARINNEGGSYE